MTLKRRFLLIWLSFSLFLSLISCQVGGRLQATSPAGTLTQELPGPTSTRTPALELRTVTATAIHTAVLTQTPGSTVTPTPTATVPSPVRFAVLGDYGLAGPDLQAVAGMILDWNPDFILTTGDNNYPDGAAETIDENIGQYFHSYIYPYRGAYGPGAEANRFFPTLGNHDWNTSSAQAYFDYFDLPGNERYYDFTWGPLHFFALNSDSREPDGVGKSSIQAAWLRQALASSSSLWKIVYGHYPPFSSSYHGDTDWMYWPFAEWGADVVLSGHDHTYERLEVEGVLHFVVGLGGGSRYPFLSTHPGSLVRFNKQHGALLVEATAEAITFMFYTVPGELIDSYTLQADQ